MHTFIHTILHSYINTYIHIYKYIYTYVHTFVVQESYLHNTYVHIYIHTFIHTYTGCETESVGDIRGHFRLHPDESVPPVSIQQLLPHSVPAVSVLRRQPPPPHMGLLHPGLLCNTLCGSQCVCDSDSIQTSIQFE